MFLILLAIGSAVFIFKRGSAAGWHSFRSATWTLAVIAACITGSAFGTQLHIHDHGDAQFGDLQLYLLGLGFLYYVIVYRRGLVYPTGPVAGSLSGPAEACAGSTGDDFRRAIARDGSSPLENGRLAGGGSPGSRPAHSLRTCSRTIGPDSLSETSRSGNGEADDRIRQQQSAPFKRSASAAAICRENASFRLIPCPSESGWLLVTTR